jgi:succinate dehydrogenase / fumarate reductase flavoprotein subunit
VLAPCSLGLGMIDRWETHERDVLVIGAGGAGLRAAIEAREMGLSVGLVCKSLLGKAHTVMAEGGVAAALANVDEQDNWRTHFRDTMLGGKLLNNWRMAQLHAQEAPERVRELERWGAVFDRTHDGRILQRAFGGHSWKRLAHVGDRTGLEMIRTLQDRTVARGVDVFMECTVTRLLKDGERVSGAFAYWRESGRFVVFKAKAVVLATGGIGKAYRITSNSWEYTADGQVLAWEAGAELIDMEFVQFHPTGMVWPPGVMGILVTEAVRGEGGILRNSEGVRFMEKYDPERMELSTRDQVARAIYLEVREGRGSPHGGVFLDISHKPADYVKTKLPSMYHQFMDLADVDITQTPMEVGPTVHYVMGGVRVEADTGASTLPGLFAAGEVAGGMHGANRLGGNSLSDLLVFGRRAGAGAAEFARDRGGSAEVDPAQVKEAAAEMLAPFENDGENPYALHRELQMVMQRDVGIFRTEEDLKRGIEEVGRLRERARDVHVEGSRHFNPGWHLARDLRSMTVISEAVARSALMRRESRGAHSRLDYPQLDERLGGLNTVVTRDGDDVRVTQSPIPALPQELKALLGKPGDATTYKEKVAGHEKPEKIAEAKGGTTGHIP